MFTLKKRIRRVGFYRREEIDEFLEEACFSPTESLVYSKIVNGKLAAL